MREGCKPLAAALLCTALHLHLSLAQTEATQPIRGAQVTRGLLRYACKSVSHSIKQCGEFAGCDSDSDIVA